MLHISKTHVNKDKSKHCKIGMCHVFCSVCVMSDESCYAAKSWLKMKKEDACISCACHHHFKYIYSHVSHCQLWPENKYGTHWGVSWVSSVIWILLGESLCRQRGKAASVSLSSHSVSGNDAKLWAMFKKHVPCNTGQSAMKMTCL